MHLIKILSAASLAAGAVAVDLRFYTSIAGCDGAWFACLDLPPGRCCSSNTVPASHFLFRNLPPWSVFAAWVGWDCYGERPWLKAGSGHWCIGSEGLEPLWSGKWTDTMTIPSPGPYRQGLEGRIQTGSAEGCVQPNAFAYNTTEGVERTILISESTNVSTILHYYNSQNWEALEALGSD
ncbi:hypothetical protein CC1G_09029 [Coprinopsis cinerea okayama7|uniref:Uncharacterized protein n=1 Tax=Coprinopsis cinerea (strain Okayama-7 / 130 / ATCC MYA-4618 / FGSC 9003) TaxID=240176 RepID=A8N9J4_COPC7|nr:hypothetical protein CC1G_09029 [Coprinopsis cinerea okayama7\|eukprot:XP_001831500.1 hypothetical protein CC1G_09029 [Coprinopsis cinerea okayama7\